MYYKDIIKLCLKICMPASSSGDIIESTFSYDFFTILRTGDEISIKSLSLSTWTCVGFIDWCLFIGLAQGGRQGISNETVVSIFSCIYYNALISICTCFLICYPAESRLRIASKHRRVMAEKDQSPSSLTHFYYLYVLFIFCLSIDLCLSEKCLNPLTVDWITISTEILFQVSTTFLVREKVTTVYL